MKKFLSVFLISSMFVLSGCMGIGSDEDGAETDVHSNNYQTEDFSLNVPPEWETIEPSSFTAEIPAGTAVVFRNNVKKDTFTANVNITRNNLKTPLTASDYAKQAVSNLKAGMFNFKEIKRETLKISVSGEDSDSIYMAFEGKRKENEGVIQFLQVYAVKKHIGYIVTGAFTSDEEEITVKKVNDMVKSLEIK